MCSVGRLFGGLASTVTLVEALHASTGVDQLLLAGEVWVTLVAELDLHDATLRAASDEGIAT